MSVTYNNYSYTEVTGGWSVKYVGTASTPNSPTSPYNGLNIVSMYRCFYGCTGLTSLSGLTIPSSVTNMSFCFENCTGLTSLSGLTIPSSVTDMSYCFKNCKKLTSLLGLTIPSSVTNMSFCFYDCTGLTSLSGLTIPSSVTNMSHCFKNCKKLTSLSGLTIPSSVTDMDSCFENCTGLTSLSGLTIPSSVTNMSYCFYGCTGLTSLSGLTIPSSVTDMYGCFYGCTGLTSLSGLTIPSSVTDMSYCFSCCTGLTSLSGLTIPSSVTNMSHCFYGCTGLTSLSGLTIPSSVTDMDSCFYDCKKLTSLSGLTIPSSVTDMSFCFKNCKKLTSLSGLTIPSSVTDMDSCFENCTGLTSLSGLTIPSSVTDMSYCFYGCTNLGGIMKLTNGAVLTNYEYIVPTDGTAMKYLIFDPANETIENVLNSDTYKNTNTKLPAPVVSYFKVKRASLADGVYSYDDEGTYIKMALTFKHTYLSGNHVYPFMALDINGTVTNPEDTVWYDNENLTGTPIDFNSYNPSTQVTIYGILGSSTVPIDNSAEVTAWVTSTYAQANRITDFGIDILSSAFFTMDVAPGGRHVCFGESSKPVSEGNYGYENGLVTFGTDVEFHNQVKGQGVIDLIYPIGSIYLTMNSSDPSLLFGGTWEQIKDKMLFAVGDHPDDLGVVGESGGYFAPSMPSHYHSVNALTSGSYDTAHYHYTIASGDNSKDLSGSGNTFLKLNNSGAQRMLTTPAGGMHNHSIPNHNTNPNSSGDLTYGNMPPYINVYIWQRTA